MTSEQLACHELGKFISPEGSRDTERYVAAGIKGGALIVQKLIAGNSLLGGIDDSHYTVFTLNALFYSEHDDLTPIPPPRETAHD